MGQHDETTDAAVLEQQQQNLEQIPAAEWNELLRLYDAVDMSSAKRPYHYPDSFEPFHQKLYDLKMIFSFPWMQWDEGRAKYDDPAFDFRACSLLEASMFLTAIMRSERFCDGTIISAFESGKVPALMEGIRNKVQVR